MDEKQLAEIEAQATKPEQHPDHLSWAYRGSGSDVLELIAEVRRLQKMVADLVIDLAVARFE